LLSQPPEKLNELARERAFKALAALGPGRTLAKWSAREKNIQAKRLEWLSNVERANRERDALRADLEPEMSQIRQRFSSDEAECNRQLVIVIEAYKPRLKQLKEEADHWAAEIEKTDGQLAAVRREVVGLERDVRLAERGLAFPRRTSADIAEDDATVAKVLSEMGLKLDSGLLDINLDHEPYSLVASEDTDKQGDAPPNVQQNQKTVQQAMSELETVLK
jgi:chromosome segregation ATPase